MRIIHDYSNLFKKLYFSKLVKGKQFFFLKLDKQNFLLTAKYIFVFKGNFKDSAVIDQIRQYVRG